jgi:imidazolonepropionase-like amidohydrolase
MKAKFFITSVIYILSHQSIAQSKHNSYLLINGTAHIGTGEVINESVIGIKNEKIILVANALTTSPNYKDYDTVIDLKGKHIYPGFIGCNTTLGLTEIDAVRSTRDFNETGDMNPSVRTLIAYNTDSKIIPTVRSNGVLLVQAVPRGGTLCGTSSVMKTSGWNWEDAVYKADDGIYMNWPSSMHQTGWWAEPGETQKNDKYKEKINEIKNFFVQAKAYYENTPENKDLNFEAMKNIFSGKANLYIRANYAKEITDALLFCKELEIPNKVIVDGYESYMVTDLLKEHKVPVILRGTNELPLRSDEDIDLPYKLPYLLQKEGILFCLHNSGSKEAMQMRNLPFIAGTAVAYGLTKEQALAAITLNAAKILRIDKTTGSLEKDKDATLIVSDGDALDMKSNNIVLAFIQGKQVSLDNLHKQLYNKYKQKYNKQ